MFPKWQIGVATLLASLSFPANAAETVIGGGQARQCYLDADHQRANDIAVAGCTRALTTETLSLHDLVATHVNRGILYMQRKDHAMARKDFDRAIALDHNEPEAYLNKGALLFKTGAYDDAIALFTTALEKDTRRPEIAYFGRGLSHELAGDLQAAYADLKKANEIAPQWEQPIAELARYSVRPAKSG